MVFDDKSTVFDFSEMQEVLLREGQQVRDTVPIEMATPVPDLKNAIPYMEMYERERHIKIPYQPDRQSFHNWASNNNQAPNPRNRRQIKDSLNLPPKYKGWIQTMMEFLVLSWLVSKIYKFGIKAAKCVTILAVVAILGQFWLKSLQTKNIDVEEHKMREAKLKLRMVHDVLGDLFGEGNANEKCRARR